ncbi:hypothetical protein GCM10010502_19450 [Kitasatospora aureofaciens]|uniref:Uncharacterized protein n=1 Tax=Kitasatospora aureofaciens TaxID=1894 RepID=A0A8H9HLP4_KITAU|nr:hypothetical protein GCM10010502_19450 [Kitasatospora aureofaciens]
MAAGTGLPLPGGPSAKGQVLRETTMTYSQGACRGDGYALESLAPPIG